MSSKLATLPQPPPTPPNPPQPLGNFQADLHDEKNIPRVVVALVALGESVPSKCPDFNGPILDLSVFSWTPVPPGDAQPRMRRPSAAGRPQQKGRPTQSGSGGQSAAKQDYVELTVSLDP